MFVHVDGYRILVHERGDTQVAEDLIGENPQFEGAILLSEDGASRTDDGEGLGGESFLLDGQRIPGGGCGQWGERGERGGPCLCKGAGIDDDKVETHEQQRKDS
jgi:hypothetical protein